MHDFIHGHDVVGGHEVLVQQVRPEKQLIDYG